MILFHRDPRFIQSSTKLAIMKEKTKQRLNAPFLYALKDSGEEFGAGMKFAVERGWLDLHESGTHVRLIEGHG